MRPEETSAAAVIAGCSVVEIKDENGTPRVEVACPSGWAAARFLIALSRADVSSDAVVDVMARRLRAIAPSDDAYARAVHGYVLRSIGFERERGEIFQAPAITIQRRSGDCDCHARMIFALLVAGGVPARLVFLHRGRSPLHVVAQALVDGAWRWVETTVKKGGGARFGEHPVTAAKRVGVIREDVRGNMQEVIMGGPIGVEGGTVYRMRVGVLAPKDEASKQAIVDALRAIGFVDETVWLSAAELPADFPPSARDEMPEADWTAYAEALYARPDSNVVEMPVEVPADAREGLIGIVLDDLTAVRHVEPVTEIRARVTIGDVANAKANPRMTWAWPIVERAALAIGHPLQPEGIAIAIAIAMLETGISNPASWGDSHNWGAVTYAQKRGEPFVSWGSYSHGDRDRNGKPITMPFQRYPNDDEGAKDFLRVKMRGGVPAALLAGDVRGVAREMYRNGYFTGVAGSDDDRINAYAAAINAHLPAARASRPGGGAGGVVALLPWLALGGAIWYTIRST